MAYRAYIGKIRKGKENEYIEAHKVVWPELIDAMKKAGMQGKAVLFSAITSLFMSRHLTSTQLWRR